MTTTQSIHRKDIPVGTLVILSPHLGRKWAQRIMKVIQQPTARGTNYVVADPEYPGIQVKVAFDLLTEYTGGRSAGRDTTLVDLPPEPLHAGVVARVQGGQRLHGIPDGTLVVSLGPSSNDHQTKVALLGGDNGNYWTGVPTENLVPIKVAPVEG